MRRKPMIARAVIKRKPVKGATVLMGALTFLFGSLVGATGMRVHAEPAPKQTAKAPAEPVRATFEPVDPFEGVGSIRVDRSSFCRQVATEALLSMRPDFTSHSIKINRDVSRRGEVIEQFAETMGQAIERVWSGEPQPRTSAAE